MERHTRTPQIDGGIVHAPPNTTATQDFAQTSQYNNPSSGPAGPETYNGGSTTAGAQHHLARDTTVQSGGVPVVEQGQRNLARNTNVQSGGVPVAEQQQRHYDPVAGTSTTEATGTGTATNVRPTSSKIKESASGVKGLAAAIHGAGEAIRGNFNTGVDRAFNDKAGENRNSALAAAGENEMTTGQFTNETKNREGTVPGADGDRRRNRDPISMHPK